MAVVKGTQRAYRSAVREEAAHRTRATVVAAAAEVFAEKAYAGATIELIAARAGVSRATVFGVGGKAHLFALARTHAATGGRLTANDEDFERLLAIPDAHRLLTEFAAFTAAISRRLGPLQLALEQAATSDPDIARLQESSQQELLECAGAVAAALAATGSLRRDMSTEVAADILWLQIQPTNYRRLTQERGWSHEAFEHWHAATAIAGLLESPNS
ncbi:TetR family transcriptional regulator [Streptomyces sp. 8L]|uniref:TetR family transcriptional regulator n=1 Tax=Streptomyces sp. 8L TaxID=2877242 RepID=UPI001CD7EB31|nr:TetR family transcriptional regulator [Streptomyces sp. 8L]MCA1220731.1 TetR family transcriptional regulator [Streptomyces sp. 8L]